MSNTKRKDMDDMSIYFWWCYLKFVQTAGFRIDFAIYHLKKLAVARSLTEAEASRSNPPYKLNENNIAQLSEEIEERKAKIETLRKQEQEIISNHI